MFSGRLEGVDTHASNIVERVFVQIHSQASGIALLGCCYSLGGRVWYQLFVSVGSFETARGAAVAGPGPCGKRLRNSFCISSSVFVHSLTIHSSASACPSCTRIVFLEIDGTMVQAKGLSHFSRHWFLSSKRISMNRWIASGLKMTS